MCVYVCACVGVCLHIFFFLHMGVIWSFVIPCLRSYTYLVFLLLCGFLVYADKVYLESFFFFLFHPCKIIMRIMHSLLISSATNLIFCNILLCDWPWDLPNKECIYFSQISKGIICIFTLYIYTIYKLCQSLLSESSECSQR